MFNKRQDLLQTIATIIADYRQEEIPVIDSKHVDKWVSQFEQFGFDESCQIVILEELEKILNKYYISSILAEYFITEILRTQEIFGENSAKKIQNFKFLKIQNKGNSQKALLSIAEQILENMYGFTFEDCGKFPVAYIYLDDCLYSGNTVRRDIDSWLSNAIGGTTLHLIFFAIHTDGYKYSQKLIEQKAKLRNINVKFWHIYEFNNSRWNSSNFDCFWARENSESELVDRYIQEVNEKRQNLNKDLPPLFRPENMPTQDNIFSSAVSRRIIESAFLRSGAYIVSLPKNPHLSMRPLGYDYLQTLGFGSLFVTYRNIANNCPLALWWGDPNQGYPLNAWYPLFPRTVN